MGLTFDVFSGEVDRLAGSWESKEDKQGDTCCIDNWIGDTIKIKRFRIEKSGMDLVLAKPFKVNQVLELVQEGLALKKGV